MTTVVCSTEARKLFSAVPQILVMLLFLLHSCYGQGRERGRGRRQRQPATAASVTTYVEVSPRFPKSEEAAWSGDPKGGEPAEPGRPHGLSAAGNGSAPGGCGGWPHPSKSKLNPETVDLCLT